MKRLYFFVLMTIFLQANGAAQNDCCTAFPLANNGTVTVNSNSGNGTFEELNSCSCLATNEHDSYWFAFTCTSSGTFEMMITPDNLSADFDFAVYSGACPCVGATVVNSCDYTGPINPPGPFVPTGISSTPMATFGVPGASEFQPTISISQGTVYWIIADNITTNGAGFTIQFAGTATMGPPPPNVPPAPPSPLTGNLAPCPGVDFNYSVPNNPSLDYEWSVDPPGPSISGNGANQVSINWNEPGLYNLCVEGFDACNTTAPTCVPVLVTVPVGPMQTDIICLGGTYEAPDGQVFFDPGLHEMVFTNALGCDSTVPLLLNLAPTALTILTQEICDGGCVEFAGETICQTGIYEQVLDTYQGCDSTVSLFLILVPNEAVILGGGAIFCNGDPVILDGSASIGGTNMTYTWTNSAGAVVGNSATLSVAVPGDYTLTISSQIGQNICTDTETAQVATSNTPPAGITATGGIISCGTTSVTLQGNSTTPNVTYAWTGPGGYTSNLQNPTASAIGTYTLTVTGPNGCTGTANASVTGDSNVPAASATGAILDCNSSSVTIMGNSNTAGVTYSWTGPGGYTSNMQNPTVTVAGTYNLTVTAPNGCSSQAPAVVDLDDDTPNISAQGGAIDCTNTSTTLMGSSTTPNVTYQWTGPGGFNSPLQNPSVGTEGTYTLTVTAPNGCTAATTANVDQNATLPDAQATGGLVDCEDTDLTILGNSNTPNVTYSWTGPNGFVSNLQNPVVNLPGNYLLTVSAPNGCTDTDQATVTADVALPDASASGGTITCTTGSIMLSGNSTTPNVVFSWVGPSGNVIQGQNPTVSQVGTYQLIVTAPNGCSTAASAEVLQDAGVPDVSTTGGTLDCNVGAVVISGNSNTAGATFSWTGPGGFTSNQAIETVNVAGNYILTITAPNNCTAQATAFVELDDDLPAFSAEGGILSCTDAEISLTGTILTPGATFEWTGPGGFVSNLLNPLVTISGNYMLTVTGPNGCSDNAVAVVAEDANLPNVEAIGGTFNCALPDVVLQGNSTTPNVTFSWSGPNGFQANQPDTAVTVAGDYVLTVTAPNGCSSSATTTVVADLAQPTGVDATGGILSCTANSLTLGGTSTTPNVQYFWTGPGGFSSFDQNPTVTQAGTYFLTVTATNGCEANDLAVVASDANAPQVSTTGATLSCNDPMVQIGATSPNQGVSYSWTGPNGFVSNQQNPTVSLGGIYTVTATAPNGCKTDASATVDTDLQGPANVIATGGTLTCLTGSLAINGTTSTGNVTYSWTGPGGFVSDVQNPTVSAAGTYLLTVTGPNGCTSTANAVVQNDSNAPTATASGGQVTCTVTSINLNGQSNTGTTFSWVGPNGFTSNLPNPAVSVAGTYSLTVTAPNGCSSTVDAVVTANTTPPGATATGGLITCQQPNLALGGNSGSTGVTYSWTGPGGFTSNQQNPQVSVGGDYTLTVTGANGCVSTAQAVVVLDANVPTATATGGTITCAANTLQLSGSSNQNVTTWSWTGPNGFVSNQQNPGNITVAGTYTLTVTTGNGCSASANALVGQDTDAPNTLIATPGLLTCDNTTVGLDATGSDSGAGFDINWTTANGSILSGQTTLTPQVGQAGVYVLTITNNANGCSAEASMEVLADSSTPTAVELMVDDDFCFGENDGTAAIGTVTGGTGPYQYSLNNGPFSNNNLYNDLAPGTYTLVVEDANGCSLTESFEIAQPVDLQVTLNGVGLGLDALPLGQSIELVAQTSLPSASLGSVIWTPTGIDAACQAPCLSLTVAPTVTTLYSVTIVDLSGCQTTDQLQVPVDRTRPVFVPNVFSPNNDGINDLLVVFGGSSVAKIKSFLVFSRWGEVVFQGYNLPHSDFTFGWDGTHRGQILDTGVYTWFADLEFVDGESELFEGDVTLVR